LNLHQTIICTKSKKIYIYDHNKNEQKIIYTFTNEICDNVVTQICSIKNKYIILQLYHHESGKEKFLIFDFRNNVNPIIKIINLDYTNIAMRTYDEPFEFNM